MYTLDDLKNLPASLDLKAACELAGGNKPIDKSTYWRKVGKGELPPLNAAGRVATQALLKALGLA